MAVMHTTADSYAYPGNLLNVAGHTFTL